MNTETFFNPEGKDWAVTFSFEGEDYFIPFWGRDTEPQFREMMALLFEDVESGFINFTNREDYAEAPMANLHLLVTFGLPLQAFVLPAEG